MVDIFKLIRHLRIIRLKKWITIFNAVVCHVGKLTGRDTFELCDQCGMIFYCSEDYKIQSTVFHDLQL